MRDSDSGPRERFGRPEPGPEPGPESFDVDTPVRPPPRALFEGEGAARSQDDAAGEAAGDEPRARDRSPPSPSWPPPGHDDLVARRGPLTGDVPTVPGIAPSEPRGSLAVDRALRAAAILAVFGLGAAGLAQPSSVLLGGVAWLGFLGFVIAGWGTIVARLARTEQPDAGQRVALGMAGYVAIAGVLVCVGVLTRAVILTLICAGFAAFAWREATARIAIWQRVRDRLRWARRNPALATFTGVIALFVVVRLIGAVATLDRNPWDDDLAYTPLVKRLLETGNLIEPFSFRRLGAYGGQTALQALGAARGSLANVHLVDKGLGLAAVCVAGARLRARAPDPPGVAGGDRDRVARAPRGGDQHGELLDRRGRCSSRCIAAVVREQWALAGLVGAATCTLRQNFLVPVAVLVAIVLISRLIALARAMPRRAAWR